MGKDIRVLLVDDHLLVREGVQSVLDQEEDMHVVGQAANGEEALSQLEKLSPDVVLMDIKMSGVDGIELTRLVKQRKPSCKVIMLTLYDQYLAEAIQAGATGYLLKDVGREELSQTIRHVHDGEVVISGKIRPSVLIDYEDRQRQEAQESLDPMFKEVQFIILPPVEASKPLRFASKVEEVLCGNVWQVAGSWQAGIALTMSLVKAMPLAEILHKLEKMSEVKAIGEQVPTGQTVPSSLDKVIAMSKLKSKSVKTLFVTL